MSRNHVHVFLSCPPSLSPSKVMQYIKGESSRKLLMAFRHLQSQYWGITYGRGGILWRAAGMSLMRWSWHTFVS